MKRGRPLIMTGKPVMLELTPLTRAKLDELRGDQKPGEYLRQLIDVAHTKAQHDNEIGERIDEGNEPPLSRLCATCGHVCMTCGHRYT